jgi:hypothetical protein
MKKNWVLWLIVLGRCRQLIEPMLVLLLSRGLGLAWVDLEVCGRFVRYLPVWRLIPWWLAIALVRWLLPPSRDLPRTGCILSQS